MTLQDATITISDGNLGITGVASNLFAHLGTCSAGVANTVYVINGADGLANLGEGPLAETIALQLAVSGGPVLAIPVANTAGVLGSVAQSGAGPVVTLTGNSHDNYTAVVTITAAGVIGTSKFKYTLDGGATSSGEIFTASTYPIPGTGITLNFAAGTYVLNETYSFTAAAPTYTTTQMGTAFDALTSSGYDANLVYVVGEASSAANAATMIAAVESKLDTAATNLHQPMRGVVEMPRSASDAQVIAALASVTAERTSTIAGGAKVLSEKNGRQPIVNVARAMVAKIASKPLGKDPSQVATGEGVGALPSQVLSLTRDEFKAPGLDSQRVVTSRTYIGRQGFYVTNWPLLSQNGSDFVYLQHGQVIDATHKAARNKMLDFLSFDFPIKSDGSGRIEDASWDAMDAAVDSAVRVAVVQPGHITNVSVRGVRTDDVLSTETIRFTIGDLPKTYPKSVQATLGFTRQIPTT